MSVIQTFALSALIVVAWVCVAHLLHLWRLKHTQPLDDSGMFDITPRFGWLEGESMRVFFCVIPFARAWERGLWTDEYGWQRYIFVKLRGQPPYLWTFPDDG